MAKEHFFIRENFEHLKVLDAAAKRADGRFDRARMVLPTPVLALRVMELNGHVPCRPMGAWGIGPLANDAAADWAEILLHADQPAAHMEAALSSELFANVDEIRAAAFLVLVSCEQGVLDGTLRQHLTTLAITRLLEMLSAKVFQNCNAIAEVRGELKRLEEVVHGATP